MATWFGKYNKNGYANLNNGFGSSNDNTCRSKTKKIYTSLHKSADYFASDYTQMNDKNGNNVIVNDDFVVTQTRSYEMLNDLKRGQSNTAFDCEESDEYFTLYKMDVFDPDVCDPQTYDAYNNTGTNVDCSNNYEGALLVDENGEEINSDISHNAVYAEIKEGESNILDDTYETENVVLRGKVYLSGCIES